jgi:hypothetical protein
MNGATNSALWRKVIGGSSNAITADREMFEKRQSARKRAHDLHDEGSASA